MQGKKLFDPRDHQVKIVTPEGKAMWASLETPKAWKDDDKEHFLCDILLTEEEAQPLIDTITGIQEKILDMCGKDDKNMAVARTNPWKTNDIDERVPAGFVQFKTKRRAFPENGNKPATPPIDTYVDGAKLDWDVVDYQVGNGSLIQIGCAATPYYVPSIGLGVTLQLQAVKVLELQKYVAGGTSDDFDSEFADDTQTTVSAATETDDDPF